MEYTEFLLNVFAELMTIKILQHGYNVKFVR